MGISVVSRVICSLSVATILAVLSSGNVQAQSATAGQRVMGAGQYAPFVTQPFPPSLTPEQQRQRDEGMSRVNRPGPPLPVGPARMAPNVPPTSASTAPQTEEVGTPPAASDFVFFQATAQAPYSTGTSTIAETHAGNAGAVVFMTGNWFASYSTDRGTNFTFVNPYTEFTSLDGGFCCDQTVIYHPGYDLMIWQLLYNYSSSTQQGSYRTAFAPASSVASSGWCYYDWNPSSFGLASGQYLDYPHVAISGNYVWYSANVYTAAGSWQDTLIWRIPLSPVTSCSGFNYNWFTVTDRFNFTMIQGTGATMYWASRNSTSSIRIYNWAENSNTIYWNDVSIGSWNRTTPYQCAGPDSLTWCARQSSTSGYTNDGRIETGWVAGGVIGFMWNASQGGSFNYPYVDVARFNESDKSLINQPIIWNSSFAWQYPAIGVDGRGAIAGTAFYGGGSYYPTMTSLIWDDYSSAPPPWEVYSVAGSGKGAAAWGDWYSSRRHGTNAYTWVATGEARLSNGNVQSWYVWFGRQRDATSLSISKSGAGTVTSSPPDINCGSVCSESFTPGQQVTLTAIPNGSGWGFLGWGGACSGLAKTCTVTVNGNTSVSARFSTLFSIVEAPATLDPNLPPPILSPILQAPIAY